MVWLGHGELQLQPEYSRGTTLFWGGGYSDEKNENGYLFHGGLYMASNVSNSCQVWNAKIVKPEEVEI